jgi:peptidoglycan/LPS O-acetylase OafA/YrhL
VGFTLHLRKQARTPYNLFSVVSNPLRAIGEIIQSSLRAKRSNLYTLLFQKLYYLASSIKRMAAETNKISVNYFSKIDTVRFIAAMMVIIYHAFPKYQEMHNGLPDYLYDSTPFGKLFDRIIGNGYFGVDVFFLLSGFLITFLLINEKEKTGKINLFNFYVRRALRIWPLFFLIALTAPLVANWFNTTHAPVYTNLLFINNFWVIKHNWWMFPTAQLWSLCIEEHFYLFWPLLVAFIPVKRLPVLFIVTIFVSFLYRFYVGFYGSCDWYKLYLHTFSRMDALAIGAYAAYFYTRKPFNLTTHWIIRMVGLLAFLIVYSKFDVAGWPDPFLACFKNLIFVVLAGSVLMQYLFNEKPLSKLPRIKLFSYLGKVSYGIYMFGLIVVRLVEQKILPAIHQEENIVLYWVLVISLSILVPVISYELFEKHFLKLKERFQIVKQVEAPQQAS